MLWLVNNLLQDIDSLISISGSANDYVQMIALKDEPFGDRVENGDVAQLMKIGYENLGTTFNFTVGRETAEHYLFVCQRYLTEVLDSIHAPAWHHKFPNRYSDKDEE